MRNRIGRLESGLQMECLDLSYPQQTMRCPALQMGVPSLSMRMESGMEEDLPLDEIIDRILSEALPLKWKQI